MKGEKASILMCTYNAQRYIREQLLSLINQTYQNIEIIIYDDCSTDNTVDIIKEFAAEYETKIHLNISNKNSGSAKNNFLKVLKEHSGKKYIFFCDQDDVWSKNKVEIMMNKMIQLENTSHQSYLVCHNSNIVDKEGNVLTIKKIKNTDFFHLIFHPEIQGCCMLINNMAIKKMLYENELIEMHDWIISLYVALEGEIVVIDEELIDYRQHENNQVGYRKYNIMQRLSFLKNVKGKTKKFKMVLNQIFLISKMVNNEFLDLYNKYYCEKKGLKIVGLLFKYNIIDVSIHGIYQSIMIILAMRYSG